MARTFDRKSYPLLPWALGLAGVLFVVGVVMSGVVTNADSGDVTTLLVFIGIAFVVALAGLAWRRKQTVEVVLPTDRLHDASRTELQGILEGLEAARAKGEIPAERYEKAKARILAEMAPKK